MRILRLLLVVDSAVLTLLGLAFILMPQQMALLFGFKTLPVGMDYIIGLWGCGLGTMAIGYGAAAVNPIRHVVWVQVGIARGVSEFLLGLTYVLRGLVTWQQAGFGIVIAGFMALGYCIFYPREAVLAESPNTTAVAAP